jgi:hypothetical protein
MTEIRYYCLVGGSRTSVALGGAGLHPELGLRLAVLTYILAVLASLSIRTLKLGHDRFPKISSNLY